MHYFWVWDAFIHFRWHLPHFYIFLLTPNVHCAWNFPKSVGKQFPICTFYGNHCFNAKVRNLTYLTNQCKCLPGCNSIKYEYQIERIHKFTDNEVSEFCPGDTFNLPKLHSHYDMIHGYNDKNVYKLMKLHIDFFKKVSSICLEVQFSSFD